MQKKIYNTIFLSNQPSFYKINLYNEINKEQKILVIINDVFSKRRNKDFYEGEKFFDHILLKGSILKKFISLRKIITSNKYDKLIINGWDNILYWLIAFTSFHKKNGVVVESSIFESQTTGLKAFIKRLFLKRMSYGFPSGKSNVKLLESLNFKGKINITHGVGIFNYNKQPKAKYIDKNATKFLFVGRLSPEKNLELTIKVFNSLPHLNLTIVGFGPLEENLKNLAKNNIQFLGEVPNCNLPQIYQEYDVFILPSISEPWGLVVEEALNNGIPVLASNKVGAIDDWVIEDKYGVRFNPYDENDLVRAINKIRDKDYNNQLRKNIESLDYEKIKQQQIKAYN